MDLTLNRRVFILTKGGEEEREWDKTFYKKHVCGVFSFLISFFLVIRDCCL